jgi:hypothetical protein
MNTLLRLPFRGLRYGCVVLPGAILLLVRSAWETVRSKGPELERTTGLALTEQLFRVVHACLSNPGAVYPDDFYAYGLHLEENEAYRSMSAHNRHLRGLMDLGLIATGQTDAMRYSPLLNHKDSFLRFCAEQDFPTPETVAVFSDGEARWLSASDGRLPARDLFVKPVIGAVGVGARRVYYHPLNGTYQVEGGRTGPMSGAELVAQLESRSRRKPVLLQHRISNHPRLKELVGGRTVATIRMVTVRALPDDFAVVAAFLRCSPRDSATDNYFTGGLACNVNLDTGELGPALLKYSSDECPHHPLTGVRFEGFRLPFFADAKALCLKAHREFVAADGGYRIPVVGWDVAMTTEGALLLEANSPCDLQFQKLLTAPLFTNETMLRCFRSHLRVFAEHLRESQPAPT